MKGSDHTKDSLVNVDQWAKSVRALMKQHNLTLRTASAKCGYAMSHTCINNWRQAATPPKLETAWAFLSCFPREEAVEIMLASNIPIPVEWTRVLCEKPYKMVLIDNGKSLTGTDIDSIMGAVERFLDSKGMLDYGEGRGPKVHFRTIGWLRRMTMKGDANGTTCRTS